MDHAFLGLIILVIFVFMGFVYSATTVNSSAYAIASFLRWIAEDQPHLQGETRREGSG